MSDDEHYTDLDISNVGDDSEQCIDTDNQIAVMEELETETHPDLVSSEEQVVSEKRPVNQVQKPEVVRFTRLPVARVKNIMKMDPDVNKLQHEAVFLVTKATEIFLEMMAKETYSFLPKNKKTINKKELDLVINKVDCLCFLEGAMDF